MHNSRIVQKCSSNEGSSNSEDREFQIRQLLAPEAFPHSVTHLRLKETLISWIVLTGRFAYKIKKPVRYPFLDASTLERRRTLCEEELRLNKRLAPDLYLDIVPIAQSERGLQVSGSGKPVEYAVRMHEFKSSEEMAAQLAERNVTVHDTATLGARLAELHDRATVSDNATSHGSFERVRTQLIDNFTPIRIHLRNGKDLQILERLRQRTLDSLAQLEPLIRTRKQNGRVRECHGDLHVHNIVRWRQQWVLFDCLEFDPDLRWIDVMSDVSFLFMDLIAHGREDLAYSFLSRYLETGGDYPGLRLLPLYATYRALVRAKVDALGAETAPPESAHALEARMLERLKIAAHFMDHTVPALILMHGVTACGKSSLSERLVYSIHAVRVRSDLERKRLLGIEPLTHRVADVGMASYAPTITQQTYARLLDCAMAALEGGTSLIVDATFLSLAHRRSFHDLAVRLRCRFLIVSCQTDRATLDSRLATRARTGLDPSEGTSAVLQHQLTTQEPLTTEEYSHSVEVDTSSLTSVEVGIKAIEERLAQAPIHSG